MTGEPVRISRVKPGMMVEVVEIRAGRGLHVRLGSMGIFPGTVVEVVTSSSQKGPVIVSKEGMRVAIGYGMAEKIMVRVKAPSQAPGGD